MHNGPGDPEECRQYAARCRELADQTNDPLAQKALAGWKGFWGTKVLSLAGVGPKFRGIDTVSSAAAAG